MRKTFCLVTSAIVMWAAGCASEAPRPPGSRPPQQPDKDPDADRSPAPLAPQTFESVLPSAERRKAASAQGGGPTIGFQIVAEAEVMTIEGDRLFALSQSSGLSIVDVSNPTRLELVGQYRAMVGEHPYAMHVLGDRVLLLYSSGPPGFTKTGELVKLTSKVLAVDVSNPKSPRLIGTQDVNGLFIASHVIGDVLYAVSEANAHCGFCSPRTEIASFAVSAEKFERTHLLSVADSQGANGFGDAALFSGNRVYLGGSYLGDQPAGAAIQIVELSERSGALRLGARFDVRGRIATTIQLDEHQGVLRVLSSPVNPGKPAYAQTFRVQSSDQVTALGEASFELPDRGEVHAARFSGDRAFLYSDALYSFNLADPAQPKLAGKLALPSQLASLEVRGDRVLGIGYGDSASAAVSVSLIDTHDLAQPKLLSRVAFASSTALDQDAGKRLQVLPELGLILVAHQSTDFGASGMCGGRGASAVTLIDFDGDTLVRRGSAPLVAGVKRAFWHRDHVLAVGDERVDSFSLADRSAPVQRDELVIGTDVSRVVQLENAVVRVTEPSWERRLAIELVTKADAENPTQRASALSLPELVTQDPAELCNFQVHILDMHGHGTHLYVLYDAFYNVLSPGPTHRLGVVTIDARDPSAPRVFDKFEWSTDEWGVYDSRSEYVVLQQERFVWRWGTVAMIEEAYAGDAPRAKRLRVVDLTDPEAPSTQMVPLTSDPYVALTISDDTVYASRFQQLTGDRIKYFVDGVDIADPTEAYVETPVNTPGAIVHVDGPRRRAIMQAFRKQTLGDTLDMDCYTHFGGLVDYAATGCTGYQAVLQQAELINSGAVLEGSVPVPEGKQIRATAVGDGVAFVTVGSGVFHGVVSALPDDEPAPAELLVVTGLRSGELQSTHFKLGVEGNSWWGLWQSPSVVASGTRALVYGSFDYAIVDAALQPRIERRQRLEAGLFNAVDLRGDRALLALGFGGVQWLDM